MASMYNPGYGSDMRANMYGQTATDEEERRRRQQGGQQALQQPQQAQQPQQPQQAQQGGQQGGAQAVQTVQPVNRQAPPMPTAPAPVKPQPTFTELQKQGQARPAPPQQQLQGYAQGAQPMQGQMPVLQAQAPQQGGQMGGQMGLNPIAAAMGGGSMDQNALREQMARLQQGSAQRGEYANMEQQRQAAMASFTPEQQQLYAQAQQLGGAVDPIAVAMGGPQALAQAQAAMQMSANQSPVMMNSMARPTGDTMPGYVDPMMGSSAPSFGGDIGGYLAQGLNSVQQGSVPQAYQPGADIMRQAQGLTNMVLPSAPKYATDPDLLAQARALTGAAGGAFPQMGAPAGAAPAGVSAAGIDPLAAAGGGGGAAPAAAPMAAGGGASPAGGGINQLTEQSIAEALRNPSAFDNAEVQRLYGELGQGIDDEFAQRRTALQEEMAGRGLADSSIYGGRMADLNVARRSAQTALASDLAGQRARDFANARAQAIGMGQGQRQQVFGEEMGRGNLGIAQGNLALNQQGQGFNQRMSGLQFQNQLGQQGFQNQMDSARFNLGAQGQRFNQGMTGLQFQNNLGQQGFQNQMSAADMQRGFGNDAYQQRMGYLDRLTNYGQQAFQNDMSQAEFNRGLQSDQDRFFLQMLGLGG